MAKYEEIITILRNRIKNEYYPAGSLLPKQTDLAKEFTVSRMTIQKALDLLAQEGLISSKKGVGTTVLQHSFLKKGTSFVSEYPGLSAEMENSDHKIKSVVIDFEVGFPNETIQDKLLLLPEEPIYKIVRLRMVDDEPFVLEYTYMPIKSVPNLTKKILENSIYHYLKNDLKIQITGAYRTIRADKSTPTDRKYLNCTEDDPILELRQIAYQKGGDPIEYSCTRNRFDIREYSFFDTKQL